MLEKFTYFFWTFVIGSVLGVIIETIWCLLKNRRFESRKGLIYGPFNPLYGVAAVALSIAIYITKDKTIGNVFVTGVVVASLIEYICSYYQERVIGTISWDYKDFPFNIKGRINLVYSLMWGVLTLAWGKWFLPVINSHVPKLYGHILFTKTCFLLMLADCLISLGASMRRNDRRKNIVAKTRLEKHYDYFYSDDVMEKIYPNSKFVD